MPGIHIVNAIQRISSEKLQAAADDLLHLDNFQFTKIYTDDKLSLGLSGYDGYPSLCYENAECIYFTEGQIYNKSEIEIIDDLINIAKLHQENKDTHGYITDFIEKSDGDFLVLIFFKETGEILLFNDRWGRLPTFYCILDDLFVLSREIKYILHFLPSIEFNNIAISEILSLEQNLGDKTLFNNIRQLTPASVVLHSRTKGEFKTKVSSLLPVNFEIQELPVAEEEAVVRCKDLYMESLRRRVEKLKEKGYSFTADLSGGFDSRAIIAGLCLDDNDFVACSDDIISGNEFDLAQKVSELYNTKLLCFSAPHPFSDLKEMSRVNYITDGLVNSFINIACFYDDLERSKKLKGLHVNFTGFCGEFVRRIYKSKSFYNDVPDMLIDDVFTHYLSVKQVCKLTNVDTDSLKKNFQKEIEKLQEKNKDDIARHLFFNFCVRAVNAGEDRHRIFNWTVSPFWGNDFFTYTVNHMPSDYISFKFFIQLLSQIDSKSLEIPIHGKNVTLNSELSRNIFFMKDRFRTFIRDNRYLFKIARTIKPNHSWFNKEAPENKQFISEILNICVDSRAVKSYLNVSKIKRLLSGKLDRLQFYQLVTIILYIYEVEKKFPDRIIRKSK